MTEKTSTMRFENKIAFVTGAAAGIGRAVAERLAEEGAHVVATDLRRTALETVYGTDERFTLAEVDVRDSAAVDAAMALVDKQYGRLDLVANVAGISDAPRRTSSGASNDLTEITDADFAFVTEVNLYGPFYVMRAALPLLRKNGGAGGAIVNLSSVGALASFPLVSSYMAAKAGVLGLTRGAAALLGPENIRVNAVAPGATDTAQLPVDPTIRSAVVGLGVLNRAATPEEMAATILFLLSDEGSFITGQTISPNGGYVM